MLCFLLACLITQHIDPHKQKDCSNFWYNHYNYSWKACHAHATTAQHDLATYVATTKHEHVPAYKHNKAIVFGAIGQHYIDQAKRAINIIRILNPSIPIHLWVHKSHLHQCNLIHSIHCSPFPHTIHTPYNAKLVATLNAPYKHVLMVDTDNMFTKDPQLLFNNPRFITNHIAAIAFPDLWGNSCKQNPSWKKDHHNPNGYQLCGQSAWHEHIIFPVANISYDPSNWKHSHELASTILLVNKQHHAVVRALKTAIYMVDHPFFKNVLYGDKDAIRIALLIHNVPFLFVNDMPMQILECNTNNHCKRAYFVSVYNNIPITIDQVKRKPSKQKTYLLTSLKKNVTCAPDYFYYNKKTHAPYINFDLTISTSYINTWFPIIHSLFT